MAPGVPLPVTTIGGYLGAGKTTLINHLLRNAGGRRLAILVNEFGELAIDEDLIEAQSEDMISIAGGCICCSFGSDLTAALMDLAKLSPRPDHIIIESSGVAIPGAIVATLSLLDGFQSDGIVVLADAETIQKLISDKYVGDTIERQLRDAEILILNKLDLISAEAQQGLQEWAAQVCPHAILIQSRHGQVAPEVLLGVVPSPTSGNSDTHADALFDSLVLRLPTGTDVQALAEELATGPYGIVRAKGFATGPSGDRFLIHVVGSRWSVSDVSGDFENAVVCLGFKSQLQKQRLRERFIVV